MSSVTLPITFKALGSPSLGAPLELVERTVTSLEPHQLLVRVSHASINAMDWKLHKMNMFNMPFPQVLGFDFSGTVVAAGSQPATTDSAIQVGSRVLGVSIAGSGGCFAEYVVANTWGVTAQGTLPDAEASTYGIAYVSSALPAMVTGELQSRKGQTIFIPGGAGGLGHFAVQLAKTCGLRVISSASKPAGLDLLRSMGTDVVIDYSKQDVVAEVLAATDGKGADIVYDTTCSLTSFQSSAAVVKSGGHWLFVGHSPSTQHTSEELGNEKEQAEAIVVSRGATILEGNSIKFFQVEQLRGELQVQWQIARQNYESGKVRPHITGTVPFDAKQLQAAMDASVKGIVGKVVVKVQ